MLSNSSWFAASLRQEEGSNVYATLTSTVAMLVVTTCSLFHVLFPTVGKAALAHTLSSWAWSHTDNNVALRCVLHVCVCVCKPLSWMEPNFGMGVSPPTFRFRYFRSLFQPLAPPHRGAPTPHSLQLLCGFDGPWQHLCIAALHLSRSRLYVFVHPRFPICVRPRYLPFFEPLRREQPPPHPTQDEQPR